MKRSAQGFALVGISLVVLLLAAVGLGGYYVWHHQHRPMASNSAIGVHVATKPSGSSSPYTGWKNATLQYEKIKYKYPADWVISGQSSASPKGEGCVYPGNDSATLTSPGGSQIVMRTGVACIGDTGVLAFGALQTQSLGQDLYLAFENNREGGAPDPVAPSFACLSPIPTPGSYLAFKSKNIFFNDENNSPTANSFCYYPYDFSTQLYPIPTYSVSELKSTKDFSTAKLILESLQYE